MSSYFTHIYTGILQSSKFDTIVLFALLWLCIKKLTIQNVWVKLTVGLSHLFTPGNISRHPGYLPDKLQGVNVLEDVFEDGVVNDPSGIGDTCESVHAETDDQEAGLRRNEVSFTVVGRP